MLNHKMVRQLRESMGLTQAELAERVKVARTMVSHIETGEKNPGYATVCRIADVFGVTLDSLRLAGEK